MIDGQCMKLFCEDKTWSEADAHCKAHNGKLARILNDIRNDWISNSVYPNIVWFGANDFEEEGVWMDSAGYPVVYTNWAGGQPDGSADCLITNWGGKGLWDDYVCESGRFCHVCEDGNSAGTILTGDLKIGNNFLL